VIDRVVLVRGLPDEAEVKPTADVARLPDLAANRELPTSVDRNVGRLDLPLSQEGVICSSIGDAAEARVCDDIGILIGCTTRSPLDAWQG
jgi:hypothetical protein